MKVLITGGAGYIGSHMALGLIDQGIEVVVLDNLTSGFEKIIPHKAKFINGDFGDLNLINNILNNDNYTAVAHFAASIKVNESVENPFKYYYNNTQKTLNFVNAISQSNTKNFIFSSTAAVYNPTNSKKLIEEADLNPLNPYGASKLMCERMIQDIAKISDLKFFILRYFNVAGADSLMRSGQLTRNATHLIKVCVECALNKRPFFELYGIDYNTHDGSCIRDYIHVSDLIDGHIIALKYLIDGGESDICNLGYGSGYSVLEILKNVKNISQNNFKVKIMSRRDGDASSLISNPMKIINKYGWVPKHNNIEKIIKSALEWEKQA